MSIKKMTIAEPTGMINIVGDPNDPRNSDPGDDLGCRTRAEWDAKYGRAEWTGKFKLSARGVPIVAVLLVSEFELLDGKVIGATGVDGIRYAVITDERGSRMIADPNNIPGWPYPSRLLD